MSNNRVITTILMVTIIIDVMGMGLVFPVLPGLFFDSARAIVAPETSVIMRDFYYGLALSVWPMGLFIGAPFFGDLSDKYSRKIIIAICLIGMAVTYVFSALALQQQSLTIFLLSRILSGFFSGSFPIAQAMMVDISDESNKAKNISLVTLAASLGFVMGPVVTSLSTIPAFSGIFDFATPFYIAAILSLLNFVSVLVFLPKMPATNPEMKAHILRGLFVVKEVLTDKRIKRLFMAFVIFFLGWGFYVAALPLTLREVFDYSVSKTALVFAMLAAGNIAGILFLQPLMLKTYSLRKCCLISGLILTLFIGVSLDVQWPWIQWFTAFFASSFMMVFYTAVMTLFSNAVGDKEQGKVMGGADACVSIAWLASGFVLGLCVQLYILLPLILGAASLLIGTLFFVSKKSSGVAK